MGMAIVVDTNIIFSMLLKRTSRLREEFFEQSDEFYSPNFVMVEMFKHKERLLKRSELPETEMYELLHTILEKVRFINEYTITKRNKLKAYRMCQGVDENDTPIVALVLELNARLWTNDKQLKRGLRKQGFKKFFTSK
jgi:predicted nucleic acid-binding protein